MVRYIELKTGYTDDGPAWIGRVRMSRSGRLRVPEKARLKNCEFEMHLYSRGNSSDHPRILTRRE